MFELREIFGECCLSGSVTVAIRYVFPVLWMTSCLHDQTRGAKTPMLKVTHQEAAPGSIAPEGYSNAWDSPTVETGSSKLRFPDSLCCTGLYGLAVDRYHWTTISLGHAIKHSSLIQCEWSAPTVNRHTASRAFASNSKLQALQRLPVFSKDLI